MSNATGTKSNWLANQGNYSTTLSDLPSSFRALRAFLLWKRRPRPDGSVGKQPFYVGGQARSGSNGSAEDRAALATFDAASVAHLVDGAGDGIGVALLEGQGLIALDFDKCVCDGAVDARVVVLVADTYAEISPSGTGVRALYWGAWPGTSRDTSPADGDVALEVFGTSGFVTLTGNRVGDATEIAPMPGRVRDELVRRFGEPASVMSLASGAGFGFGLSDLASRQGWSLEQLRRYLFALPANCDHDSWMKALAALHHETEGSEDGFALAVEWSRTGGDAFTGESEVRRKWNSFGRRGGAIVGGGWLRKQACDADPAIKAEDAAARAVALAESSTNWRAEIAGAADEAALRQVATAIAADASLDAAARSALVPALKARAHAIQWAIDHHAAKALIKPSARALATVPGAGASLSELIVMPLEQWQRSLRRHPLTGDPIVGLNEIASALLRSRDVIDAQVGYDVFLDVTTVAIGDAEPAALTDQSQAELRSMFESLRMRVSADCFREALDLVRSRASRDSLLEWAEARQWDGTPRIATFFAVYGGAADSPYHRAVARYLWTALAGRALVPGVKADMVPILTGPQGLMKSSLVRALAPTPDMFSELNLADDEANIGRAMRGKAVLELGELRGFGARESDELKAFITKTVDSWTPKFKEHETVRPRRCLFIGTTNQPEFLADETGARRFLPLRVDRPCDPDAAARDREQLWAEAVVLFKAGGVAYSEAETLAKAEHEAFSTRDAWHEPIAAWLDRMTAAAASGAGSIEGLSLPEGWPGVSAHDVMQKALDLPVGAMGVGPGRRVAAVLRKLGWERTDLRQGRGGSRLYVKKAGA